MKDSRSILFVQFANSAFLRHGECDRYWDVFYRRWHGIGYYMGRHVFEIPKWIAEISYFTAGFEKEVFYCIHGSDDAVQKIEDGGYDFVLMSLMNANQGMAYDVISRCKSQTFIVGGYNERFMKMMQSELPNVRICATTADTAMELGVPYAFGTDYSLFKGEHVIPRLTLSYGCLNKCRFCIVPHGKVEPVPDRFIVQQVESFSDLDYRLVYIDDKTFGQSQNYRILSRLSGLCTAEAFNGFIVQTTTADVTRKADEFADIGVRVAEIGLESYNDSILRAYRKPSSEKAIRESVEAAHRSGLMLIANIIIGLPGETDDTYARTYDFVMPLLEDGRLIGINPAIYTDYSDDCNLGEIDFMNDSQYSMNKVWWDRFNSTAADILERSCT